MTEVEFNFNVGDKLEYSCRLLRKAHAGGAKLLVTADPVMLAQLDQMLWTLSATEFLPHCRSDALRTWRGVPSPTPTSSKRVAAKPSGR